MTPTATVTPPSVTATPSGVGYVPAHEIESSPLEAGDAPAPDVRVKITKEYARHVGRDAFFWAWPLVNVSPVVIQVPDFGDRFWVYQAVDLRTDGFVRIDKMYGTTPGFYLLVAGLAWRSTRGHHRRLPSLDQHRVHRPPRLHGRYGRGSEGDPASLATAHAVPAQLTPISSSLTTSRRDSP